MRAAGQGGGEGGGIGKDSSHILFPGVLGLLGTGTSQADPQSGDPLLEWEEPRS